MLTALEKITCFVFDVDGVLTNGTLIVMPDGLMVRTMNIKDGYAIQLAIKKGMEHIAELSDKEEDFIDRAVSPRIESRLGCQCELKAGSGEIEVTLPDQTQFLGE